MRILLAVFCLGLAACVPLADHPVGNDEHALMDARWQGVWRPADADEGPMLLFAGPNDEAGHGIHLLIVEEMGDRRWKTSDYDGVTTRRGGGGFLSIRYETTDGDRRGWAIARYAFVGPDRLQLWTLDETRLAAGVRAGKIPGKITGEGPNADVDLTMNGADLLAFLESRDGRALFDRPRVLVRGGPASGRTTGRRAHQSTGSGVAPTPSR
jgi:hypothetical protein